MLNGLLAEEHVLLKLILKDFQKGKIAELEAIQEITEIIRKTDNEIKKYKKNGTTLRENNVQISNNSDYLMNL